MIIHGEIGSGIGRVAAYALRMAHSEGMDSIAIRCRVRAHPLSPLRQIQRDLIPFIGHVPLSPEAIGSALQALTLESPLLLLIENIEHCSADTIVQLQRMLSIAHTLPTLITGTAVPEGIDGHQVLLRPLTAEESRQLICEMLGTLSPPAGLCKRLHRISGGQPGILVSGLRELSERGGLICKGIADDGTLVWQQDPAVPLAPTAALSRLFGEALSELDRSSHRLLEVMAVAGEEMPLAVLLDLAGCHPSGEALGPLLVRGLADRTTRDEREWVSLRRPAVGSLILNHLPQSAQAAIHRGLASALSAMPPSDWRDQLIAWHRAYGAPPHSSAGVLIDLGEDLLRRGQSARALSVLDRAGDHLQNTTLADQVRLAVLRGELLEQRGRREEALESLAQGRKLAKQLGSRPLLGRALLGLATVYDHQGRKQKAVLYAEQALTVLRGIDTDISTLKALLLAADCHRLGARRTLAAELYNRCIDMAIDQDRRQFAARGHGGLGAMLAEDGHLPEAILHIEQEAAFARLNHIPSWLVPALYRLSICHRRMGRIDLALEALDEAEHVASSADLPYELARARIGRAMVHLVIGDVERTRALLSNNRLALQPSATAEVRLAYRETMAHYRLAKGDRQAAMATFQTAEQEAEQAGFAVLGAYFLGMVGVLTANPDSLLEAMDLLEDTGDRRLSATLLYYGGTVGGDAEVLEFAVDEARASGDQLLLLDVLHAAGGDSQREARCIIDALEKHMPRDLVPFFRNHPSVRWARITPIAPAKPDASLSSHSDFQPDFKLLDES